MISTPFLPKILVLFGVIFISTLSIRCGFDSSSTKDVHTSIVGYSPRRAHEETDPIRIKLFADSIYQTETEEIAAFYEECANKAIEKMTLLLNMIQSVDGNLIFPIDETNCGVTIVPEDHKNVGVSDADLVVYLENDDENSDYCSGGGGANAKYCERDQTGRVIFGALQICPQMMTDLSSEHDLERRRIEGVILHELVHILGISQYSFEEYINPETGMKYEKPMKTFTERGHEVTKLVTPKALAAAREHFGCPELNGLELEDLHFSHLEYRIFYGEVTTKSAWVVAVVSKITLSILEDSGWYSINWENASDELWWGRDAGCDFALKECLVSGSPPSIPSYSSYSTWCFEQEYKEWSCSFDLQLRARCDRIETGLTLPSYYQYYTDDTTKGNSKEYADGCPLFYTYYGGGENVEHGWCKTPNNGIYNPTFNFGEKTGANSFCFDSSLLLEGSSTSLNMERTKGFCYDTECSKDDENKRMELSIFITKSETEIIEIKCQEDESGEQKTVGGYNGFVICPHRMDIICGKYLSESDDSDDNDVDDDTDDSEDDYNHSNSIILTFSLFIFGICILL